MKTKKLSKSVISLILAIVLTVSMVTVGMISAYSVEVDETGAVITDYDDDFAESGANGTVTVYFENVRSWSNVYVCFLNGDTWNNSGVSTTGYSFQQMSLVSGKTYKYTYTGNYSQYIVFCKDKQDNYGNLWQTEAAYRGDFNPSTPYFTPSATANGTYNSCTYYNNGSWAAAPSQGGGSGTIYFENTLGWSSVYYCFRSTNQWDNNGTGTQGITMQAMTKGSGNTWSATYSSSQQYVIFCKDKQDNYGNLWQTQACFRGDFNASTPYFTPSTTSNGTWNSTVYYNEGTWAAAPQPATETPTAPPVVGETIRLAIGDDTTDRWLGNDDARFKVVINGAATAMTKSVDVASGLNVWYADVAKINGGTSIKFQRSSAIDSSNIWNTWTTSYVAGSPLYKIGDDDEITPAAMLEIPDGSVTNFGYGIWVDTKGNADTKDFVKIYAEDFVKNTTYDLYLPAYTNWAELKVYTNFPTLKINDITITKGQVNTINLSTNGIEKTWNISFKRNTSGSTHSGQLHIMRAGTAGALLMSTNEELYTGLTAAYADNGDGTANYEGVAAYKSLISTKGKFAFYTAAGEKLNTDDGLKKVKPRGNSTFEASMRLYGKTAYNITLSEKAPLIEGCESSKKYSLLANNADETMMRNLTVYGIADEVGMPYTPNTRLIDLFDNGTYLGTYVLTEKVEYGKNTLISKGTNGKTVQSLDKANEDILAAGKGISYDDLKQVTGTYTAKSGTTYQYQYSVASEAGKKYEFDGSKVTIGEGEEAVEYTLDEDLMKSYDFLMEHEINGRYQPEATWFVSGRTGQAVVPKYPEFATQKEAQWMIEQYDALETATYSKNYTNLSAIADVESFASTYLIQELTENLDAGATSYYILGGYNFEKLLASPLWDYDWAAGMYNGKKLTYNGEVDVADYSKKFVTEKSVKIDANDGRTQSIRNLQAQMTQIPQFWTECKRVWTNKFTRVLNNYLGDGKTLLGTNLPNFRTAAAMNESRWNVLHKMNANPENYWGTRSTTQYKKGSYSFAIGGNKCTGATYSYDNTVYFLNDWLTKRREFMDKSTTNGGIGLYDTSLIETEAPTDPPTDPPTEAPTDPPTEPETELQTDAPETYIIGDADNDGEVSIMDVTKIQKVIAVLENDPDGKIETRGKVTLDGEKLNIMDATAIQKYLATLPVSNCKSIGATATY